MFLQQPDVLEMHIMRLRHFSTLLYIVYMLHHVSLFELLIYTSVCDCKGLGNLGKSWEILRIFEHVALLTSSSTAACDLLRDFVGKTDFTELQRAKTETNVQQSESKEPNHSDSQR